jgi:hypothetical protein
MVGLLFQLKHFQIFFNQNNKVMNEWLGSATLVVGLRSWSFPIFLMIDFATPFPHEESLSPPLST